MFYLFLLNLIINHIINDSTDPTGVTVLLNVIFAVPIIIISFLVFICLYVIRRWLLFKKAGEKGWKAIIPFYSDWIYLKISEVNPLLFIFLISYVTIYFIDSKIPIILYLLIMFLCNYKISKKLHESIFYAIFVTFLPIDIPNDNYTWNKDVIVSKNGPIKDDNNSTTSGTNTTGDKSTTEEKKDDNSKKEAKEEFKDIKYCPHCGKEVDKDSKFCGNCGKEI